MSGAYTWAQPNAYGACMQRGYAAGMSAALPIHEHRRARIKLALGEFASVAEMARVIDTPRSHLSAIMSGAKGCGNDLAAKIEHKLRKPPGWLDAPTAETQIDTLAHAVSQRTPIVPPKKVIWEDLVSTTFEGQFVLAIKGDALVPNYLPGQSGIWQSGSEARSGQPVLLRMPGDHFEVRIYEDRGTTWAGVAVKTGHRTLTPEADHAEVVARLKYLDLD